MPGTIYVTIDGKKIPVRWNRESDPTPSDVAEIIKAYKSKGVAFSGAKVSAKAGSDREFVNQLQSGKWLPASASSKEAHARRGTRPPATVEDTKRESEAFTEPIKNFAIEALGQIQPLSRLGPGKKGIGGQVGTVLGSLVADPIDALIFDSQIASNPNATFWEKAGAYTNLGTKVALPGATSVADEVVRPIASALAKTKPVSKGLEAMANALGRRKPSFTTAPTTAPSRGPGAAFDMEPHVDPLGVKWRQPAPGQEPGVSWRQPAGNAVDDAAMAGLAGLVDNYSPKRLRGKRTKTGMTSITNKAASDVRAIVHKFGSSKQRLEQIIAEFGDDVNNPAAQEATATARKLLEERHGPKPTEAEQMAGWQTTLDELLADAKSVEPPVAPKVDTPEAPASTAVPGQRDNYYDLDHLTERLSKFMDPEDVAPLFRSSEKAQIDLISAISDKYDWGMVNLNHYKRGDALDRIWELLDTLESHKGPVRYREDGGDAITWKLPRSEQQKQTWAQVSYVMPPSLAKSSPNYTAPGTKGSRKIVFADDYDKAAYILANDAKRGTSKSATALKASLEEAGADIRDVIAVGKKVVEEVKAAAKAQKGTGPIRLDGKATTTGKVKIEDLSMADILKHNDPVALFNELRAQRKATGGMPRGKGKGRSGTTYRPGTDDWKNAVKYGTSAIRAGAASIKNFTDEMVHAFGEAIREHAEALWLEAKAAVHVDNPGSVNTGPTKLDKWGNAEEVPMLDLFDKPIEPVASPLDTKLPEFNPGPLDEGGQVGLFDDIGHPTDPLTGEAIQIPQKKGTPLIGMALRRNNRAVRLASFANRFNDIKQNVKNIAMELPPKMLGVDSKLEDLLFPNLVREQGKVVGRIKAGDVMDYMNSPETYKRVWGKIVDDMKHGNADQLHKLGIVEEADGALKYIGRAAGVTDDPFKDFWSVLTTKEIESVNPGLSAKRVESLAKLEGDAQVFVNRDDFLGNETGMGDRAIKGIEDFFNGGETRILREGGQLIMFVGDQAVPFPKVLMNVAGRRSDYLAGIGKAALRIAHKKGMGGLNMQDRRAVVQLVRRNLHGFAMMYVTYKQYQNSKQTVEEKKDQLVSFFTKSFPWLFGGEETKVSSMGDNRMIFEDRDAPPAEAMHNSMMAWWLINDDEMNDENGGPLSDSQQKALSIFLLSSGYDSPVTTGTHRVSEVIDQPLGEAMAKLGAKTISSWMPPIGQEIATGLARPSGSAGEDVWNAALETTYKEAPFPQRSVKTFTDELMRVTPGLQQRLHEKGAAHPELAKYGVEQRIEKGHGESEESYRYRNTSHRAELRASVDAYLRDPIAGMVYKNATPAWKERYLRNLVKQLEEGDYGLRKRYAAPPYENAVKKSLEEEAARSILDYRKRG